MKKLLLILLGVFLISNASAFTFINIFVDSSGNAVFLGESDEENLILPSGIEYNNGEISGITSELTSKEGNLWAFSYSLENSEITVVLPTNAVLKNLANEGEIFLQDGRISVYYAEANTLIYEIENSDKNNEMPSRNVPLIALLIGVMIILVAFVINYSNREKRHEKEHKKIKREAAKVRKKIEKQDNLEVIKQVLNERERAIVDKLKEVGRIKSSFLRRELDMPKASFSRHIQELEKKGILKRTGEGRNKFVELVK